MRNFSLQLLVLAWLIPTAFAAEKDELTPPALLPVAGVMDPGGKTGIVTNPTGGVDALDLATGKVLWSSNAGNRPLIATAERIYLLTPEKGKANQMRLVVLDIKEGKKIAESEAIVLPEWIMLGSLDGQDFRQTAYLSGDTLLMAWQAHAWYTGGAAPTKEVLARSTKNAEGVISVALKADKLVVVKDDKLAESVAKKLLAHPATVTRDGRSYQVKVERLGKPFGTMKRHLVALGKDKAVLWEHEIVPLIILAQKP